MSLPPRETMLQTIQALDPAFDGVFFTAVKTTGIFWLPRLMAAVDADPARRWH